MDAERRAPPDGPPQGDERRPVPFGQQLRAAREARGLSLQEISDATKVTKRQLEALERGDLAALPAGPFARGFIQAYAQVLGIDPGPVLEACREEDRQRGVDAAEAERRRLAELSRLLQHATEREAGAEATSQTPGRLALAVLGLLVVAALGWWSWTRARGGRPSAPTPARAASHRAPGDAPSVDGSQANSRSDAAATPAAMAAPSPAPTRGPSALRQTAAVPSPAAATAAPAARSAVPGKKLELPTAASAPRVSPATAAPKAEPTPALPAPPSSERVRVAEHGVGSAVVDRRLVGRADRFTGGTTAAFWTLVLGGEPGQVVRHTWFDNGRPAMKVDLRVASGYFRTHSRLALPAECSGNWAVEARTIDGRLLARDEFACEPAAR